MKEWALHPCAESSKLPLGSETPRCTNQLVLCLAVVAVIGQTDGHRRNTKYKAKGKKKHFVRKSAGAHTKFTPMDVRV